MKRILLLLAFLLIAVPSHAGDTGTYNIDEYRVQLEPRSDGTVLINYYLKWSVTGGHIPWITVGLPNDNFTIEKSGNAVAKIKSANESGWSGVRIDLDRDYKPGESFEVSFEIIQNKLFSADDKNYKLEFTPGWYDNAFTDKLTVSIHFFAKIKSIKADPAPKSISDEVMTWERTKMGKGEQFDVSISFPKKSLKTPLPEDNMKDDDYTWVIILVIVVIIIIIVVIGAASEAGSGYSGGGIFSGGGSSSSSSRGSGGGGGFGGRSSGCDCACVSCACACACAGGGGAGCSRKNKHSCPICKKRSSQ